MEQLIKQLADALEKANDHLDWIGWGDSYERECATNAGIQTEVEAALEAAKKVLES